MADDFLDLIEQLKRERSILLDGGYRDSTGAPKKDAQLLRDSVTCLNVDQTVRKHPCSDCLLWEFVPKERLEEDIPCHHIPLTAQSETISTLEDKGDRGAAKQALLAWLDRTILQLEGEASRRPAP
jgi:hypothetical protein